MKLEDRKITQQKVDELKPKAKTCEEQDYVIRKDGIYAQEVTINEKK